MSSFLGPHISLIADQDAWFARVKPRIAKILLPCDPTRLRDIKAASPNTLWIGRLVLDSQPMDDPAKQGRELGERIVRECAPYHDVIWGYEGFNEPDTSSREVLAAYCEHEIQRSITLHRAGLKSIVGNFSTGCPDLPLWLFFQPALEYADALGLHEYDAPGLRRLSSWLCGRFVRIYQALPPELRRPLAITEAGCDGGIIGDGRTGWKRYMNAATYMRELIWYSELLASYADRWNILGACIFCSGSTFGWDSYSIDGAVMELMAQYEESLRKKKPLTVWQGAINLLRRIFRGRVSS